jgi:hypothetical protein
VHAPALLLAFSCGTESVVCPCVAKRGNGAAVTIVAVRNVALMHPQPLPPI